LNQIAISQMTVLESVGGTSRKSQFSYKQKVYYGLWKNCTIFGYFAVFERFAYLASGGKKN